MATSRHSVTTEAPQALARYSIIVTWDAKAKAWSAAVPAFDGIATCGSTVEEALEMARELIELHIEFRQEKGEPLPVEDTPVQVHRIDVAV